MASFRLSVSRSARSVKPLAMLAAAGLAMLACLPSAQAAEPTPLGPGPVGNFSWKGFNWEKRFWGGAPQYNLLFDAANVSNPDANGYVTLKLTNPTGGAPVGAEFQSTRQGFGYGTYSTTVEKNLSLLQKEVVWGCLFTYDPLAEPGFNEIDLCEASAWGGGASYGESWPVTQGHGYWFDAGKPPGEGNNTTVFDVTASPITTHRMVWEPGKLTFETYAGEGFTGALLKRTVLEGSTVPVPGQGSRPLQPLGHRWRRRGSGAGEARVRGDPGLLLRARGRHNAAGRRTGHQADRHHHQVQGGQQHHREVDRCHRNQRYALDQRDPEDRAQHGQLCEQVQGRRHHRLQGLRHRRMFERSSRGHVRAN